MSPLMLIMLLSFFPFPMLAIAMFTRHRMKPARQAVSR